MGYFVRAFCKNPQPPKIQELLDAISKVVQVELDLELCDSDLVDKENWEQFAYKYDREMNSILIECNEREGEDSLAEEEIDEFLEMVHSLPDSDEKSKVQDHLKSTAFVISCRLPTSDITEAGYNANDALLAFLEEHYAGLIQADGEGFYAGDEIILPE
ncbi:MAG: hypothetical protein R3F51_19655 [Cyanobacteriota/Melainabacteria group bacterium]